MSSFAKLMVLLFGVLAPLSAAEAACECGCVNGVAVPICQKAHEKRPICGPAICRSGPAAPPSVPGVPPPNTAKCQVARVQNAYTTQYEWRRVCL